VAPWENIEYMAVISNPIKAKVENIITNASIKHHVLVKPDWYY
jgi:hypothetical protein